MADTMVVVLKSISLHCSEAQMSHLEDKGVRLGDQTDSSSAAPVPLAL